MSKNKTLSIHIGLGDKQRTAVIEILNLTLADTVLLGRFKDEVQF